MPGQIGAPPQWLDDIAKAHWHEVIKSNGKDLTQSDRGILEMLCKVYSRWRQLENELDIKGMVYCPGMSKPIVLEDGSQKLVGKLKKRPQAILAEECRKEYCSLAAKLGIIC